MSALRVAQHTLFNFVTIACNAIASLVVTAVIARWLSPQGMGPYSLVTSFFAIAGLLVNMGFVTTTMKYMATALGRGDHQEAGGVLAFGLRRILRNGVLITAAWLAVSPLAARGYHQGQLAIYMAIAAVAIVPAAAMTLLTAATQGLQRYGQVAFVTGVYTTVLLVGSLGVLRAGGGTSALLAVNGLAAIAACALYCRFLGQTLPGWFRRGISPERRKAIAGYSGSLMILIVLDALVWQRSGVFFLGAWAPPKDTAFYAMAFSLATMAMRLIPGTLVGLLIPSMSRSFGSGDLAQVAQIYRLAGRWMAILALPVAAGGAALAPALVRVMYGAAYAPVAPLLAVLFAAGALTMTFGFPASSVLYAVEGQRYLVRTGLGVAVGYLLLAVLLIPHYGATGAAWATAIGQCASLLPGCYFAAKMLGGVRPSFRYFPATLASALIMGVAVAGIAQALRPTLAVLLGVPAGAVLYALGLVVFGALAPEDWVRIRQLAARVPGLRRLAPRHV